MQKLLLAAVATTAISSSALALDMSDVYFKAEFGGATSSQLKSTSIKFKPAFRGVLGLGVGMYLNDNVRADLTFRSFLNNSNKAKASDVGTISVSDYRAKADPNKFKGDQQRFNDLSTQVSTASSDKKVNITGNANFKYDISSIMVGGYFDFKDLAEDFVPFIGARIGYAFGNGKGEGNQTHKFETYSANTDTRSAKFNLKAFAIGGTAGVGVKVADNVMLDVAYSYDKFGDFTEKLTKEQKDNNEKASKIKNIDAHTISAGVRVSL